MGCRFSIWSVAIRASLSVTLIEPDVFKPHNVERHLFPLVRPLANPRPIWPNDWLLERRPDLDVRLFSCDLLDPRVSKPRSTSGGTPADIGVCAADNEPAKFHWDALMRRARKPWTLGEVLSGGIGGFVHWFAPGGPCYGCVASHLQRTVTVDNQPTAGLFATGRRRRRKRPSPRARRRFTPSPLCMRWLRSDLLNDPADFAPGFTSLLLTLQRVPGGV